MAEYKKMSLVFGDVTLGVHGEDFDYIFSYQTGGPESLAADGVEWLYRTPKPTFWRATTDNDRGSHFSWKSSMWLGANLFIWHEKTEIWVDGVEETGFLPPANNKFCGDERAEKVKIRFTYLTTTTPQTHVTVSYTVQASGKIRVDVHYEGREGLPELPVFGLRFIMPACAEALEYEGLSGETYPDRMAGGIPGVYREEGLSVTPYLVPQDCGVHMDTRSLTVFHSGHGFTVSACEKNFAFSCLPYTAEELENATHQEELPPGRRTVLCILGAVRGVGGIDSWGSEPEAAYHISGEKDMEYSFFLKPGSISSKD